MWQCCGVGAFFGRLQFSAQFSSLASTNFERKNREKSALVPAKKKSARGRIDSATLTCGWLIDWTNLTSTMIFAVSFRLSLTFTFFQILWSFHFKYAFFTLAFHTLQNFISNYLGQILDWPTFLLTSVDYIAGNGSLIAYKVHKLVNLLI